MKLKRLYIGDFGILRNQILDKLNPGIVVVGGKNRAGKSTFMEVLRNLAWGFSVKCRYPANSGKYEVSCDLETEDGELYTSKILGYAEPTLSIITRKGMRSGGEEASDIAMNKVVAGDVNMSGPVTSMRELYSIDPFLYKSIFTINLNQLQRVPPDLDNKSDSERLQAILLGAGLSDYVQLPRIAAGIMKEADRIGGRNGSARVKMFSPHYSNIEEGIKQKNKALGQVETYLKKKKELAELNISISKVEEERKELLAKISVMDVLKSNFHVYREMKECETSLDNHEGSAFAQDFPFDLLEEAKTLKIQYLELIEEKEQKLDLFKSMTGRDDTDEIRNLLKNNEEKLKRFSMNISGLKERIIAFKNDLKDISLNKENLLMKMKKANSAWKESDWEYIKGIQTDISAENKIKNLAEAFRTAEKSASALEKDLELLKKQKELLEANLSFKNLSGLDKSLIYALCWLACFIIAGVGLYFIAPLLSIICTAAAVSGALLFILNGMFKTRSKKEEVLKLRNELTDTVVNLECKEEELLRIQGEKEKYLNQLSEWKKLLLLDESAAPETLISSMSVLQDLQDRILKLEGDIRKNVSAVREIRRILSEYCEVLEGHEGLEGKKTFESQSDLMENQAEIFAGIEKWHSYLKPAEELLSLERREAQLVDKLGLLLKNRSFPEQAAAKEMITSFVSQGEAASEYKKLKLEKEQMGTKLLQAFKMQHVRDAINLVAGVEVNWEADVMEGVEKLFEKYLPLDEINRNYDEYTNRLKVFDIESEKAKKDRISCINEIEQLSASGNLEKAQKRIDEARSALKPLAINYAVNSAAAAVLEKVQADFLGKMHEELLGKAAGIFSRLTGGEYTRILPPPQLTATDLQVENAEGVLADTADILSRGTCEQLYLSVRLSRIMETKPALPVIIDDSLVNFDASHTKQTVKILSELSRSHQIFIMTCHPELIEYVASMTEAQYWKLEGGSFSLIGSKELSAYLS